MLTGIRLPNGVVVSLKDAYEGNIPNPPAPLPYLRDLVSERNDNGSHHVTDLLIGTREAYLKKVKDYTINFDDGAFSLLGRSVHAQLDHDKVVSEIPWDLGWIQGKADLLENINGDLSLTDYKVQGAYAVAKFIGMDYKEVPVLNDDGTPQLYKSGKNAGKPRTKKEWYRNPAKADQGTIKLQLNMYRVALNQALSAPKNFLDPMTQEVLRPFWGQEITKMRVFFIVRDASTRQSSSLGIDQRTYFEEVEFMPDKDVTMFFARKEAALSKALESRAVPELCSDKENWEGRKCNGYCPVADHCRAVGDNPYLTSENQEDDSAITF